jgi:hypothetical protein
LEVAPTFNFQKKRSKMQNSFLIIGCFKYQIHPFIPKFRYPEQLGVKENLDDSPDLTKLLMMAGQKIL